MTSGSGKGGFNAEIAENAEEIEKALLSSVNKKMDRIAEKDWKHLRALQEILIERYCEQTMSYIRGIVDSGNSDGSLSQVQKIYQHIVKRDKTLIRDLNDFRRSNAMLKIEAIQYLGLFTNEEFEGFSDELRSKF